jgi:hypothetical protein
MRLSDVRNPLGQACFGGTISPTVPGARFGCKIPVSGALVSCPKTQLCAVLAATTLIASRESVWQTSTSELMLAAERSRCAQFLDLPLRIRLNNRFVINEIADPVEFASKSR